MRPDICRLMACSHMVVLPEYEEHVPGVRERALELPVTIWVRLTDGCEAQATMAHHRGMPQDPATEADLIDKFTMCSAGRHPPGYGRRVTASCSAGESRRANYCTASHREWWACRISPT